MQPPPEQWRPSVSDCPVQATHVDAALAKIACAKLGYFQDKWTEQLMRNSRPYNRSPLIHRGYYSRVAAIRSSITRFLDECPEGAGAQIVDLGAGLDATYFWLRDNPELWRDDLTFFEVDFPEILGKKAAAILKHPGLWPLMDANSQEELTSSEMGSPALRAIRTKHLRHVSADMRMVQELDNSIKAAGIRPDVPTIFVSECVLVYMQALQGDAIIDWAAKLVPDAPSSFVLYEQFNPNDPFGKVMIDNLMKRGCPLLSIHEYPTLESQRERFLQRGWDRCLAVDMDQVYDKYLDVSDVERIQRLELLDEFEEWHLIQKHYFLSIATRTPGESDAGRAWVHDTPILAGVGPAGVPAS